MKKLKNSENLGNCFVLLQTNNLLENTLEGECDRDTHKFLEKKRWRKSYQNKTF